MKPKLERRTPLLPGFALSHSHFVLLHEFPFSLGRGQSLLVTPTERGGPQVTIASNDLQRSWHPVPSMDTSLSPLSLGPAEASFQLHLHSPRMRAPTCRGGRDTWEMTLREVTAAAP